MSYLRRALAGASATALLAAALVAGGATPAAAESSSTCQHDTSTRLFSANGGDYQLWVEKITPYVGGGADQYHICWKTSSTSGGDLFVTSLYRGDPPPLVTYETDYPYCPELASVQDPVQLVVEGGWLGLTTLCLGVGDDSAILVGLNSSFAIPSTQLWLDKNTAVGAAYCDARADLGLSACPTYATSVRVF